MKLRYLGKKKSYPVVFPIGCKNTSAVERVLMVSGEFDLGESDADKLLKLDPVNFEKVFQAKSKKEK